MSPLSMRAASLPSAISVPGWLSACDTLAGRFSYGSYDHRAPAPIGAARSYHVELWPPGNRFQAGHRIRLDILGASAASLPTIPAVNTIAVGGPGGARLLLPVLPGSDLAAALRP
jgi:hypothetical protein